MYHEQSNNFDMIPEQKLYMVSILSRECEVGIILLSQAWPTVLGFSFTAKKWGELTVENLSPVVFDETAFDTLVLPSEKKALIRALVENCGDSFSDIISGKGGGCIFLLHGRWVLIRCVGMFNTYPHAQPRSRQGESLLLP